MLSRKVCTNVQTATFSGRECSPLHYGLSAEGYDLGIVMEGYDKLKWCVKVKNNRKVWVRYTIDMKKMTYEEPIGTNIDGDEAQDEKEAEDVNDDKQAKQPAKDAEPKEEKKITDYNMFLTYRLNDLKKNNPEKKNNKELFAVVIAEWKELKKNKEELTSVMEKAKTFHNNSKK